MFQLSSRLGEARVENRLLKENEAPEKLNLGEGKKVYIENFFPPALIRTCFKLAGLYRRGQRNTTKYILRNNDLYLLNLPQSFEGYRILHLTDMHIDMDPPGVATLIEHLNTLEYDLCVLTGDYRAATTGPIAATIEGMRSLVAHLKGPIYAVLGNHDSIQMVHHFEAMGIRVLLNEHVDLAKGNDKISLIGIDDAHYFRNHDLEKPIKDCPGQRVKILLSHTPEIFHEASQCGYDVCLSGHTHGGQICLPGGIPIVLASRMPRALGRGAWKYGKLQGYTSTGTGTTLVNLRFNCPPEIVIHRLINLD